MFSSRFAGTVDKMSVLSPTGSDAEIPDDMAPQLDFNVDWLQIRKNPAAKIWYHKIIFKGQQGSNLGAQRQIEDVDLLNLNQEQRFAANMI